MKYVIRFASACALVAAVAANAQADTLTIATEGAYPPFNTTNSDGTVSGFDVDITNALCERMNAQCKIVAQDWDGIIPGLMAKNTTPSSRR